MAVVISMVEFFLQRNEVKLLVNEHAKKQLDNQVSENKIEKLELQIAINQVKDAMYYEPKNVGKVLNKVWNRQMTLTNNSKKTKS